MIVKISLLLVLPVALSLIACDQVNERLNRDRDNGKAIGAACRHSGRALEDCYQRNSRIAKSDIYQGWREMNEYMLAKKIDVVPPPPDVRGTEDSSGPKAEGPDGAAASSASAAPAATEKH